MVSPILPIKRIFSVASASSPPLIKTYTDIKQFVKQLLHLNHPNHMQLVEQAVKLTTTASGQYADAKRQIGEALCVLLLEKKAMVWKKYFFKEKAAHFSQ